MDGLSDFIQAVAPGLLSGIGAALAFVARISSRVTRVEVGIETLNRGAVAQAEQYQRIEARLDETRNSLCRIEGRLGMKR